MAALCDYKLGPDDYISQVALQFRTRIEEIH